MVPFQVTSYNFRKVPTYFFFRFLLDPHWTIMAMETAMVAKLPFAVPKLRRFLGAPYVPMKRHAVEARLAWGFPNWMVMVMYGDFPMIFLCISRFE